MNFYLRNVENIECISRGSPGNRTFYLSVTNLNKVSGETDSTSKLKIWLEKEQLVALCLLLKTPEESQGNIEGNIKENSGEFNLEVISLVVLIGEIKWLKNLIVVNTKVN